MRSSRRTATCSALAAVVLATATVCAADSIKLDQETLDNVYIDAGSAMYFVRVPEDGRVLTVAKDQVNPGDVQISADHSHRRALRETWRQNRTASRGELESTSPRSDTIDDGVFSPAPYLAATVGSSRWPDASASLAPNTQPARQPDTGYVTDGIVRNIHLEDVRLGNALTALLRPLNLDYSVHGDIIWVSSAQKVRTEAFEPLEWRVYELKNLGAEILPKVIVQNPSGGGMYGGGGRSGGGMYGGGGRSGGGMYGGGGRFGGGGMYGGGGVQFSNISQLFVRVPPEIAGEEESTVVVVGGPRTGLKD